MTSANGLLCFTNCLIPLEDGSLVEKDLWIDERRGVVVDSQVSGQRDIQFHTMADVGGQRTFYLRNERPERTIDLGGRIIRYVLRTIAVSLIDHVLHPTTSVN